MAYSWFTQPLLQSHNEFTFLKNKFNKNSALVFCAICTNICRDEKRNWKKNKQASSMNVNRVVGSFILPAVQI